MDYAQTLEYLYTSLPEFQQIGSGAYKPGLDRARALDEFCGCPHRRYRIVHVAGTNGKGSVAHMTAALLQGAGYKTGLFTSPHIKDFRERIRINGEMIPEERVIAFVERCMPLFDRLHPSFFEMTSAMAFDYFAEENVDFAVIETGLGGRLDSTNIIRPVLSVITNIGLDHTALLGDTKPQIAAEKAGIIKPDTPVVIGESDPETDGVFLQTAEKNGAPIRFADKEATVVRQRITGHGRQHFVLRTSGAEPEDIALTIDLQGRYQRKNIVTVWSVLQALRDLHVSIPESGVRPALRRAAESTGLTGRWQVLARHPYTVCDIAHNAHGFVWIVEQLHRTRCRRLHMVFGMVSDKDVDSVLNMLPKKAEYYFTAAAIPRAMPAAELQRWAAACGLSGNVWPSVAEAVAAARAAAMPDDMIYIGGSTFIVAEAV
jgi:dihydrofolate synthase/folylpolyglutamate synthase